MAENDLVNLVAVFFDIFCAGLLDGLAAPPRAKAGCRCGGCGGCVGCVTASRVKGWLKYAE